MNREKTYMKFRLCLIAIGFAAGINSYAQSDTLLIKLKNGTVEKIAVSQIKKIQFENVTSAVEDAASNNSLQVKGNYPNPFEENTNIEFEIKQTSIHPSSILAFGHGLKPPP